MFTRCGLGHCPSTKRKISAIPSIFSPHLLRKTRTGKKHSQSQEPRKSAQCVENDFHDHAFSLGRKWGSAEEKSHTRGFQYFVFWIAFGFFLWIGLTSGLTCLLYPSDRKGRDDVRQQRLESFNFIINLLLVNI